MLTGCSNVLLLFRNKIFIELTIYELLFIEPEMN